MPIALPSPQLMCRFTTPERARGLRIAVGHGDDRHFLQAEDVLDARILDHGIRQRQLGRARVAEQILHAEIGEHVEKGLNPAVSHDPSRPTEKRMARRTMPAQCTRRVSQSKSPGQERSTRLVLRSRPATGHDRIYFSRAGRAFAYRT